MLKFKKHYNFVLLISLLFVSSAQAIETDDKFIKEPLNLEQIKDIKISGRNIKEDETRLKMRMDAMEETALSYGALSGLIHRNWEIYNTVMKKEIILDAIFNFSSLAIPSHYGTLIEPPIISESENSFLLGDDGMTASISSKIYSIGENVKIITTPRNWRDYLLLSMDLEEIEQPDIVLRPKSESEREFWDDAIEKGWVKGVEQAEEIFSDKLALLLSDYTGMIRYKKLLAQKMVSAPFAVKENRGVTGDSNQIIIDDKAVIITNSPALNKVTDNWEPTER